MKKVVQNVIQESIYNLNDYAFKLDINNVDCELKSKLNNHADNQIMFINNVSLLANLVMDEVIMCLMANDSFFSDICFIYKKMKVMRAILSKCAPL